MTNKQLTISIITVSLIFVGTFFIFPLDTFACHNTTTHRDHIISSGFTWSGYGTDEATMGDSGYLPGSDEGAFDDIIFTNLEPGRYEVNTHGRYGGQSDEHLIIVATGDVGIIPDLDGDVDEPQTWLWGQGTVDMCEQNGSITISAYNKIPRAVCSLEIDEANIVRIGDGSCPIVAQCSVSPTTAQVGEEVTWSAGASGGTGTHTYTWSGDVSCGVENYAIYFDGDNDYISIPDTATLDLSATSFTISAWIYTDIASGDDYGVIVAKGDDDNESWKFRLNPNDTLSMVLGTGSANYYNSTGSIALNTPQHVAVTFNDVTNTVTFYIDGAVSGTSSFTGTITTNTKNVFMGERLSTWNEFEGLIEDVRIYNRALSSSEIDDIYNYIPVSSTGLVGHWEFDEGSGTLASDSSGNGNAGTLVNGPVWVLVGTTCEEEVVGNYSLDFDGVDDYVDISKIEAKEEISHIRQNCSGYSNCYTSLQEWNDAKAEDLIAADKIAVAIIEGIWTNPDTTPVKIDGWTTDSTNYIKIYTTEEARHNGAWDTNAYRLTASDAHVLEINANDVIIEGLQIELTVTTNSSSSYNAIYVDGWNGSWTNISHNIIKEGNSTGTDAARGIYSRDTDRKLSIWNNIIYDFRSGSGRAIHKSNSPIFYIYNNTIYNCDDGINFSNASTTLKNNIVQNCNNGYHNGTYGAGSDYNISDIAGDNTGGANDKDNTTVSFVNAAGDDFHLASGDTSAKDAGIDLSLDARLPFFNDAESKLRSGAWDIGADEQGGDPYHFNYGSLDLTTDLTIASWVKSTDANGWIVGRFSDTNTNQQIGIEIASSKAQAHYEDDSGADTLITSAGNINDNIWHHVAMSVDTSTMKMYLDGSEIGSGANIPGGIITLDVLRFGYQFRDLAASQIPLAGEIDDVRIYNRVLSSGEIYNLSNSIPVSDSGLVGRWTFEEAGGILAIDSSGIGNTGILMPLNSGPEWILAPTTHSVNTSYTTAGEKTAQITVSSGGEESTVSCINSVFVGKQCENEFDDDGDTLIDINDPGCYDIPPGGYNPNDDEEINTRAQCDNYFDDDGDTFIDYLSDPDCEDLLDDDESTTIPPSYQCSDGINNDYPEDNRIDSFDPGCYDEYSGYSPFDVSESDTLLQCSNFFDDDRDGLTDAIDPGCSGPSDNLELNTKFEES